MTVALNAVPTANIFIEILLALTLFYGCASDIKHLRLPNAVSAIVIGLFLLKYALQGSAGSLNSHLVTAGLAFLLTFGLYAAGMMGAGDVKLIAALMLWAGPDNGPAFLILMTFIGGATAALLVTLRKTMEVWPGAQAYIPSRRLRTWASRGMFPYGIAICSAGLILIPSFFLPAG